MSGRTPRNLPVTLAVSIVVFHPDAVWLEKTLRSLTLALDEAKQQGTLSAASVFLVDNGAATANSAWTAMFTAQFAPYTAWLEPQVLAGHGNCGYGAANNLAFARTDADYLLALNPDVEVGLSAIDKAIRYLAGDDRCGMITPVATDPDGTPLFLVKDHPRLLTLAIRGFAPRPIQELFRGRMDAYDRADQPYDSKLSDARIVSGCFMLMPRGAFIHAGGFDPGFFLYFEDFDLSYRISQTMSITRLPESSITHGGGQAARKGWRHIFLFARSALRFFGKHGWRW